MNNAGKNRRRLCVVIDENVAALDARTQRVIFCAVEISPESFKKAEEYFSNLKARIYLEEGKKFHFTDINDRNVRLEIIDVLINLGVKCKTFIFYGNVTEAGLKEEAIKNVISDLRRQLTKKYDVLYMVESAAAYKGVIKGEHLTSNKTLTIIADAFCYTFAHRLDFARRKALVADLRHAGLLNSASLDKSDNILFNKLSLLNRLEVYDYTYCKHRRCRREFKLSIID